MDSYLDFSGSPVNDVQDIDDPAFLAGPAFCAAMKLLSGVDPASPSLQKNIEDMRAARADGPENGHAHAVELMARGEPSAAALAWDDVLAQRPHDILAHKCAHETWFLVGNVEAMLASSSAAIERLSPDDPCFTVAAAQHGFALEENGAYEQAEGWGRLAIERAPRDCWALHCLAHVYETQNRHHDAMSLIEAKQPIWAEQNLLSAHIWWHMALRLIEAERFDDAIAVFDDTLVHTPASDQFRLTDGTSLLWRLELQGINVGDRWQLMADKWAQGEDNHQNPFLDLHGALAFAQCPDHRASARYFETLDCAFDTAHSELANTYRSVAKPLARAIRAYPEDKAAAARAITQLLPELHRIGGSIVQREIVERSYSSALVATAQHDRATKYLDGQIDKHPNTPWVLRDRAMVAEKGGDIAMATLLQRRADAMFAGWS